MEAINAHAAAVSVKLDCVEAHRRRAVAKATLTANAKAKAEASVAAAAAAGTAGRGLQVVGGGVPSASMIAPLLLRAGGGSKDGREAVKKCAW